MHCSRCQHENPPGMKFCGECAAPLSSLCASCGTANPPGHKFCGQCAAPLRTAPSVVPQSYTPKHLAEKILTSKAALEGERKQVTVLFADQKGSMELLADRDPEEARKLLDPVLEHMMEAVHRYEGTVNQVMGDGRDPSLRPGLSIHLAYLWAPLPRGGRPPVHGERGRRLRQRPL